VNFSEILKGKTFGIPTPLLAVIVLAGGYFVYTRFAGGTSTAEDSTDTTAGDGTGETSQPIFSTTDVSSGTDSTSTTETTSSDTNTAWTARAVTYLVGKGYDHTIAEGGLANYLAGETLTYEQNQAVKAALAQYGPPPEGITGVSAVANYSGPAVRQGTPPTKHVIKGSADDSYQELARLYYGRTDAATIRQLQNANRTIAKLSVGVTVTIPKHANPRFITTTARRRTAAQIAKYAKVSQTALIELNPKLDFTKPLKVGIRVQVA